MIETTLLFLIESSDHAIHYNVLQYSVSQVNCATSGLLTRHLYCPKVAPLRAWISTSPWTISSSLSLEGIRFHRAAMHACLPRLESGKPMPNSHQTSQ